MYELKQYITSQWKNSIRQNIFKNLILNEPVGGFIRFLRGGSRHGFTGQFALALFFDQYGDPVVILVIFIVGEMVQNTISQEN